MGGLTLTPEQAAALVKQVFDDEALVMELAQEPNAKVTGRARGTTLNPPEDAGLPVLVASLEDLACMKLSAIAGRGAARDFWDLHAIIQATGEPLQHFLQSVARKYPAIDLGHVVRSLAYFGDAEADPLPAGLERERWKTIRADFEGWIQGLA